LVYLYSTIKMMHGPINIRIKVVWISKEFVIVFVKSTNISVNVLQLI